LTGVALAGGLIACQGRPLVPDPGPTPSASGTTAVPTDAAAPSAPVDAAAVQAELLARWNAAADLDTSSFDFHWYRFDQFPHPTYKGGTREAYQAFAEVLLLFFQSGDDFDFLARNQLFELPLVYIFPSGQSGLDTSFKQLATDFSSSTGFGDIPDATRQALKGFLDRMP
jgi:hypothetical protein